MPYTTEELEASIAADQKQTPIYSTQELEESIAGDTVPQSQGLVSQDQPKRTAIGTASDIGVTAAKGVTALGHAAIGIADIPMFGHMGKSLEAIGYDFEDTQKSLSKGYSPAQKYANKQVRDAKGFTDSVLAMSSHPSTILTAVGETIPTMLAGGAIAKGLGATTAIPGLVRAATGEGLMATGAATETLREKSETGVLTPKEVGIGTAIGIGTGAFNIIGGSLAKKAGFLDIDSYLAGIKSKGESMTTGKWLKSIAQGGFTEGALEEVPQTIQEEMWMNVAENKPILEGIPKAAATALMVGGAMGGGVNIVRPVLERQPSEQKVLSKINAELNKNYEATKKKNLESLKSKNLSGEQLEALKQNVALNEYGVTPSDIQRVIENNKIKRIESANLQAMLESAPTDAIRNGILSSPRGQAMSALEFSLVKVPTQQEVIDAQVFAETQDPSFTEDVVLEEPITPEVPSEKEEQQARQTEAQAEEVTTETGEIIDEEIIQPKVDIVPDTSTRKTTVSEQVDIPLIQELEEKSRKLGMRAQQAERDGDQKKADKFYTEQEEIDAQVEAQPIDVEEVLKTTKTVEQLDYDLQDLRDQQMEAEDAGNTETAKDLDNEVRKVEVQAAIAELQEIKDSLQIAKHNEDQLKRKEDEIDSLQTDIDTLLADKSVGPQGKTKRAAKVEKYRQEQILKYFKQAQEIPLENRSKESLQKEYKFWVQNVPPSDNVEAIKQFEKDTGLNSYELLNRMKKIGKTLREGSKRAVTQRVESAEAISIAKKKDSKQKSDIIKEKEEKAPEVVEEKAPEIVEETMESLQIQAADLQIKIDKAVKQHTKVKPLRKELAEVESKIDDLRVKTVEETIEQPLTKAEEKVEAEETTPKDSIKLSEYTPVESDTIALDDIFSTTLVQAQKESDAKIEQDTKDTYEAGKKSKDKTTRDAAELMSRIDPDGTALTRDKYTQTSHWITRMLSSPEYTFLKDPAASKVVAAAQRADQVKFEIQQEVMGDFIEVAEAFKKYSPKKYEKAGVYLREGDRTGKGFRLKKKDGIWYGYNPKGVRIFKDEHREAASEALIEAEQTYLKGRMDKDTREFVKLFRELMTRSLYNQNLDLQSQIDNAERYELAEPRIGDPDSPTIAEAIAQSGDLEGTYFPRIRLNKEYYIRMSKEGVPDILFTADLLFVENKEGLTIANKAKAIANKLTLANLRIKKHEKEGYTVVEKKQGSTPSEVVFDVPGLLSSMEALMGQLEDATSSEEERAIAEKLNNIITKRIAEIYKAKGNLSSKLKRSKSYTIGFETDPIKAAVSHAQRISAGIAKRQTARDMLLAFTGRDQSLSEFKKENPGSTSKDYMAAVAQRRIHETKQKELYADVRQYMTYVLKPNTPMGRALGYLKAATVVKYLGFRVSSAAVNMTNMVAAVPATMSAHSGISLAESFKLVGEASTKYAVYRSEQPTFKSYKQGVLDRSIYKLQKGTKAIGGAITKPVKLTNEDYEIFNIISHNGWDEAHFNIDATRAIQDYAGTVYNNFISHSMYMFGAAEKANRAMSIFAAYKAHKQANPNMKQKALLELAHHTSDRAHGSYGKATKPYLVQKYPILDLAYMFTKFQHNYILNMLEIGFKKKDIPAALHMLLIPGVIAGAGASILAAPIAAMLKVLPGIDSDDPEEELYAWTEKNLGKIVARTARHGIVGGAFNISFKGSMQSPLSDLGKIKDAPLWALTGAPGGVIKDEWEALQFARHGEWSKAIEKALPSAAGTPLKALRVRREGATTKGYAPKFFGKEQIGITGPEIALMMMAFNPARTSGETEKQWHEKLTKMSYKKDRDKINRAMRRYTLRDSKLNPKQVVKIQSMMNDYNKRVSNSSPTLNEKYLSWSKLHQNLQQSMKPSAYERAR